MQQKAIRPFSDTLRELRRGDVLQELSVELNKVVEAVRRTQKDGSVTLTLKVGLASKSSDNAIMLTDIISSKLPRADSVSLFYATNDNNLQKNDPNQGSLEFSVVPSINPKEGDTKIG